MDEKTKQKLLEELRKKYQVNLKPLKEAKFSVSDITNKYMRDICTQCNQRKDYNSETNIAGAIRKIMCLKYKVETIQDVEPEDRLKFREDTEKFIKGFILKEE